MTILITEATIRVAMDSLHMPPSWFLALQPQAEKTIVILEVPAAQAQAAAPLRLALEQHLAKTAPVQVVLTAQKPAPVAATPKGHAQSDRPVAPDVQVIIAVASGKGGVGKSTVAVNLALAAAAAGLRVGLLDADIYGPSLPMLLNLPPVPPPLDDNKMMIPPMVHGIKAMSIGFMVKPDQALVWRGAMVHSAIGQMLRDVAWGDLHLLIVDMPPGTGDAQLTMAQQGRLSGAVIVSTPQDLALLDARRGIAMFQKVNVPILGLVENMSVYHCPNCGHEAEIFGHGGAKAEAEKLNVPFLGAIPLELSIRTAGDAGLPIVLSAPHSAAAQIFKDMAQHVIKQLEA